jgi:hypothetical protein
MDNPQAPIEDQTPAQPNKFEGLLWLILFALIFAVAALLVQRNWLIISNTLGFEGPVNFDQAMTSNGLHDVTLDNGRAYDISYETSSKRDFAGLVRHTSTIHESSFAILTFDILVTSGDFSNPDLVQTGVSNHHFTWMSSTNSNPAGTINLLHTVPINEEVNQALRSIQNGDTVIITGYDIYQIQGYDPDGDYIGYWQDTGCNTTLVINVEIVK